MKNIFLLVGMGRWDRGTLPSWILKFDLFLLHFQQKNVALFVFRRKKEISPHLGPPWNDLYGYFCKNPLIASPLVKIFPTPMLPNYGRFFP